MYEAVREFVELWHEVEDESLWILRETSCLRILSEEGVVERVGEGAGEVRGEGDLVLAEAVEGGLGDFGAVDVELSEVGHVEEMIDRGVREIRVGTRESIELRQFDKVCDGFVRDRGLIQIQAAER